MSNWHNPFAEPVGMGSVKGAGSPSGRGFGRLAAVDPLAGVRLGLPLAERAPVHAALEPRYAVARHADWRGPEDGENVAAVL